MARALSGAAEQCDLLVKAYTGKKKKKRSDAQALYFKADHIRWRFSF